MAEVKLNINYPYPMNENRTVLERVAIRGTIDNLVSRVTVTQEYHNHEKTNIEAVYTFPLPVRGVLLDLEVTIGKRKLKGIVKEKFEARDEYEDAVAEGDKAIMLEQLEQGMYSMNVGNIQAGEKVIISFTYAELLCWQEGCLRFFLPTTIAPRYGNPAIAGLEEYQTPETDILTENKFSLQLKLRGELSNAGIECPSHHIQVQKDDAEIELSLSAGQAVMDRDFICLIKLSEVTKNMAISGDDFEGYVAMAALIPEFPRGRQSRNITMVIDCSGSMGGDSIFQARNALREIVTMLRPKDRFNIIAFGSTVRTLFSYLTPPDAVHLVKAKNFIRKLDANMGGTEIGEAIDTALADPLSQDVILVTDGEVWRGSEVIEKASRSGRRIFTVGVGSAVAEGFVRSLAEKTGGACELVSPNEEMSDKIVRHAARIFKPYCKQVSITWPGTPIEKIPLTQGAVFSGDTKFIFARYNEPPKGKVQLACKLDDGLTSLAEVELDTSLDDGDNTLARLIAHETLSQLDDEQALQACLKYQLMSDKTNYLVIDSEGEKAEQLPGLRKIPNTLAAGWGGSGTIIDKQKMCSVKECDTIIHNCMLSVKKCLSPPIVGRMKDNTASYDIDLNKIIREHFSEKNPLPIISIDELFTMGFAEIIIDELRNLVDSGFHEEAVVAAFMISLVRENMGHFSKVARTVYGKNAIDKNLLKLTGDIVPCKNF